MSTKTICQNRKARHDYFVVDKYEAGMVLLGTEVKSLRLGRANLKDSFAKIKNGEIFLYNMHIGACPYTAYGNHDPLRARKLLLHKEEIRRLTGKAQEQSHTLVPLEVFFKDGKAKVTLALAKGKKSYDKRDTLRKRDADRELHRSRRGEK